MPRRDRPLLLDLFCGAGGCAVGYARAGFRVVGVDHLPQPSYPFPFVKADALEFLRAEGRRYDVVHASPPCQHYSVATKVHGAARVASYPDLVAPTRALLRSNGRPYVIENVVGAPLAPSVVLCGTMFGLRVYRHRKFESDLWPRGAGSFARREIPPHLPHRWRTGLKPGRYAGYSRGSPFITVAGHNFQPAEGARAMGVDWVKSQRELAQMIPPAYTEWVGAQVLKILRLRGALPPALYGPARRGVK
jgi:hypothetical protein